MSVLSISSSRRCSFISQFLRNHSFLLILTSIISLSCPVFPVSAASPREEFNREATSPLSRGSITANRTSSSVSSSVAAQDNLFPPRRPERKQRFCLNRLRDALQVVCSTGTADRMPSFFSPSQITNAGSNLNGSSSVDNNYRTAKRLRNEISTMGQPRQQRRHILRRRSRRNIVRECCEKPCSYYDLSRYCSQPIRDSGLKNPTLFSDNQPQQGNDLSSSPKSSSSSPPHQQCVSVADLQTYYLKFFRKQWKKDGYRQGRFQETESPQDLSLENNLNNINDDKDDDDYATFQDSLFTAQRKHLKQSTSQPTPGGTSEVESRDVNEIKENTIPDRTTTRINQSGNIRTLPPIHFLVNLPRGTNDYTY